MKLIVGCFIVGLLYSGALLVKKLMDKIDEHEDIIDSDYMDR